MKLNFAILTILSAVSALPIIEKRANNNPYLVCEEKDYSCKQEQSTLCYEKANDCWKTETDYSRCSELNTLCSEIWSYQGPPQNSGSSSTTKSVPTTTSAAKAIPTTTSAVKALPTTTSAVKALPTTTSAVKALPTTTSAVKALPTTTSAVKALPTTTSAVKALPTTTSSVKALPTTTSAVKEIPNTTSSKAIPTSGATEGGSYKPSKENVKIIGRGIFNDDYLWFGLTDSGIEYKFTGKSTSISVSAEVNSGNPVRYYVYTDGKLYADSLLEKTSSEVTIEFDEVAEHVVTFIKVSECANGTVRITGISADGKIEPTDVAEKKIEFIGDSITCAYGVDGKDTDTFSTKNENGVKSYAYKVAKKFNADYSMVSYSGFGIISGYSTDGKRNEDAALPQYYDKLGFSYWNQFDGDIKQMKEVQWNFEDFVPDLIVINLGTNDNSYMNNISADKKKSELAAFVTEYQEFITKIRSANPDADILCTLGIMGQELYPQIEEAVSNYKKETGDEKVNAFKFNVQNLSKNGKAVDWHPAHQSHVDAAYELIEEIESLYGWTSDASVNIEVDSNPNSTAAAESKTTKALASSTVSTKSPPPTSSATKLPPTTYLTSKAPPALTTTTSTATRTKSPPPTNTTTKAPPVVSTTTTAKNPPPQITTKAPPVVTTTTTAKNPPPQITTKAPPVVSTTTTAKNPPPQITTKAPPVVTTTTTAKNPPPQITTKAPPVVTTTTTAKNPPPQITTKAPPVVTTTTTAKNPPPQITTKNPPVVSTTTTSVKEVPLTTTTTKALPPSSTTTTTTKALPPKTTTTTTKALPPSSTTTTKALPPKTTTTTTKALPPKTTTTTTTKSIPKTTSDSSSAEPTSSSQTIDYYSCGTTDYDCKNEMSRKCYDELAKCWSQPYNDSLPAECQKISDKCAKIYN